MALFVNGVRVASGTSTFTATLWENLDGLTVAAFGEDTASSFFFDGDMEMASLHLGILTDGEINRCARQAGLGN